MVKRRFGVWLLFLCASHGVRSEKTIAVMMKWAKGRFGLVTDAICCGVTFPTIASCVGTSNPERSVNFESLQTIQTATHGIDREDCSPASMTLAESPAQNMTAG